MPDDVQRVGPVLLISEESSAVVQALKQVNPGLTVEERGSYMRVMSPERCILDSKIVTEILGRSFVLPVDLERLMPSFKGRFTISGHEALWRAFAKRENT